ncbi:MAG: potassium channel family protein [Haloarculaceae archaeon]
MNLLYLLAGIALLVLAVVDLLWTTLWVDGSAGPLSSRLTSAVWQSMRRISSGRSRLLSVAGPVILVVTLVTWIGLIWAGWTLVFAGGGKALIDTRAHEPVTWLGRIYYVAYTMFTMGNGDFSPNGSTWQLVTSLTTASGMLFVTMSVTYVLSVLRAVVKKRSVSTGVTGLGNRGDVLAMAGWDDSKGDFSDLDSSLSSFATELDTLAEQHDAYPILHYYHSQSPAQSSAVAVAVLDEALTLLRYGVPDEERPNDVVLQRARSSTGNYLRTLNAAFIHPAEETPPAPDLSYLRDHDAPTVSEAEFQAALDDLEDRRRKLLGMVRSDAWEWLPRES